MGICANEYEYEYRRQQNGNGFPFKYGAASRLNIAAWHGVALRGVIFFRMGVEIEIVVFRPSNEFLLFREAAISFRCERLR